METMKRWGMFVGAFCAVAACVGSPDTKAGTPSSDAGGPSPSVDAATPGDPCARLASCATCTPVDGCGWCGASGRCMSGSDSAPTAGTCGGRWAWLPTACASPSPSDGGAAPDGAVGPQYACPGDRAITFDTDVRGDTSASGWNPELTAWFARSDVACSPGTEAANTRGPYQVFTIMMPPASDWAVVLTPDPGVQANLAAVWQHDTLECLPLLGHYPSVTCEYSVRNRTGDVERSVRLNATTRSYAVRILVNTPTGGRPGGFTLRVRPYP